GCEAQPVQTTCFVLAPERALRVTSVPRSYSSVQSPGQEMPGPLTLPVPVPPLVTVSCCLPTLKVAVTPFAASIVTLHLSSAMTSPHPVQTPGGPPPLGVAVRMTSVPWSYSAVQVPGQLIAPGELVIVPEPDPALVTVSSRFSRLKVAVTPFEASIVTLHSVGVGFEAQ